MPAERPIRVLLLEDSAADARLVRAALKDARRPAFQVVSAARLAEALARLEGETFDVVLADLHLPDADGLDVVVRFAADFPSLPVVVLSGAADEDLALEAVQRGAQDYLVKGEGDGQIVARAIRYAIERKRTEERLAYLARHDPLTGLANRHVFRDRLRHATARADREGGVAGVVFLDLDRFKEINDSLGHDAGDAVLVEIASRLRGCVRETDTVARLGGDEFTLVLEGLASREDAAAVAAKILEVVSLPVDLGGSPVSVTASLGIALHDRADPAGPDVLIRNADAAMYRSKEGRRAVRRSDETSPGRAGRPPVEGRGRPALA